MPGGGEYIGRFAPSPTGPLHFGSAVAALASYLDAHAAGGRWLLRIEDLDPPRDVAEAPGWIMGQLRALGLHWDGDVLFQSTRLDAYEEALRTLDRQGLLFPCTCSRQSLPPVYPGRCFHRTFSTTPPPFAVRLRTAARVITMTDRISGTGHWHLADDVGAFIVKRKDGFIAYQLAVVVDDAAQGVTDVVRGLDLLDSTPRQIWLQQCLGYPQPRYAHFPVVSDERGYKLSKQTGAPPIATEDPVRVLEAALGVLGQQVPRGHTRPEYLLREAIDNWSIDAVRALGSGPLPHMHQ